MLYFGDYDKAAIVRQAVDKAPGNIYLIGDRIDGIDIPAERYTTWADLIEYDVYYRFLASITSDCWVIVNNVLHTTNRYCLHYNCIRHYLKSTRKRIIFDRYPIKTNRKDVMIFRDFDSENPFSKEPYTGDRFPAMCNAMLNLDVIDVKLTDDQLDEYQRRKAEAAAAVKRDPDIIPRRLLKWSEAQNSKLGDFDRKDQIKPHMKVAVNQTKVDRYYLQQLLNFREELNTVADCIY